MLAEGTYVLALLTSIAAYRLSPWHPLSSVPGPLIGKVSKVWMAYIAWTGKGHEYYALLHERYGTVVRIGPNDISVTDKTLFPLILGAQGMPKGPVWSGRRTVTSREAGGHRNLHAVRDLQLHAELRKPWNKAFGKGPLHDYEVAMVKNASVLVGRLHELCENSETGQSIDIAKWLSFYAFDFMGDMVFGKSYNFLTEGDPKGVWNTMQDSLIWPSVGQHIPWIAGPSRMFPSILKSYNAMRAFIASQAKRRAAAESVQRDLFYHLIKHTEVEPGVSILPLIMNDAVLAVFGGSDTTATTLSSIVYYLVRYPEWQTRLRDEVLGAERAVGPDIHGWNAPGSGVLAELEILNAVINETMRLQPAAPTGLQRGPAPGSGGRQLGSLFLPEGTTVQVPPYAVHRDFEYFAPHTKDFWPERWLKSKVDADAAVTDRSAFIPFSMGPANCAGKALAMKQLRYTIALLVREFELRSVDGWDWREWEEGLMDRFLMVKGELPVVLLSRKKEGD